jgi:hypothetical protein
MPHEGQFRILLSCGAFGKGYGPFGNGSGFAGSVRSKAVFIISFRSSLLIWSFSNPSAPCIMRVAN